jgi:hypothetical protein
VSLPAVPSATGVCPLCESAITDDDSRCPACGYDLAGVGTRPAFTKPLFWWTAMGFVVLYLVTLALVAATR